MQEAYILYGKDFHLFLNVSYTTARKIVRDYSLKNPADYVKSLSKDTLIRWVRTLGSFKRTAQYFNVSIKLIHDQFEPIQKQTLQERFNQNLTISEFEATLARLGSVALASRVWNVAQAEIELR